MLCEECILEQSGNLGREREWGVEAGGRGWGAQEVPEDSFPPDESPSGWPCTLEKPKKSTSHFLLDQVTVP